LELVVLSPPDFPRRNLTFTPGVYGNSIVNPLGKLGLEIELVGAWPYADACSDLRAIGPHGQLGEARTVDKRSYAGKAMLILRGNCAFGLKSHWAQMAGAAVAVIYACSPNAPSLCSGERDQMYSSSDTPASIPSLMLNYLDGSALARAITQARVVLNIPGTGPIDPADRAALTAISQDFDFSGIVDDSNGQAGLLPSFSNIVNTTWDPCLYRLAGVWCQGNPGRIVILDLASANITGTLSPAIGNLTALQQLSLNNNRFTCTSLHCSFGQLSELKVLNLFNMHLISFQPPGSNCLDGQSKSTGPATQQAARNAARRHACVLYGQPSSSLPILLRPWSGLTNLLAVDASYNALTEFPESMLSWTSLRALNFANNLIKSDLGTDAFVQLNMLEYINVENNGVWLDMSNVTFSPLSSARYLYLSTNNLHGDLREDLFDSMPALLEFDLSNNRLTGRLPLFRGTSNLVRLDFGGNELEGNCTAWLMNSLKYLSLGGNKLSEPLQWFPYRFESLEYLDLSSNQLSVSSEYNDIGSFLFALLPTSIQIVHLENNRLAGEWKDGFLSTFSRLQSLYLGGNLVRQKNTAAQHGTVWNQTLRCVGSLERATRCHCESGPRGQPVVVSVQRFLCGC
jgi:Leucine-rich repeat (LRR) protein